MIAFWLFLVCSTSPPILHAEASTTKLHLTDSVEMTLTIVGDSPLRVEAPTEWLLDAIPWRARLLAPPTVVELPNERSRWQAKLKLIADAPAEKWLVQFRTVRVQAGQGTVQELSFPPLEFEVRSSRMTEEIRGPMDVEEAPTMPDRRLPKVWYAVVSGVIAALFVLAMTWKKLRRPGSDNALSPVDRLKGELFELAQSDLPDSVFTERLSHSVRGFLEGSRGLPATQRTTGELASLLNVNALEDLLPVLSRCDEVRFAGECLAPGEREGLLRTCREYLGEKPL